MKMNDGVHNESDINIQHPYLVTSIFKKHVDKSFTMKYMSVTKALS